MQLPASPLLSRMLSAVLAAALLAGASACTPSGGTAGGGVFPPFDASSDASATAPDTAEDTTAANSDAAEDTTEAKPDAAEDTTAVKPDAIADVSPGTPDAAIDASKDTAAETSAPAALPVMVYGVVMLQKCGSKEAYESYTTMLVDPTKVTAEQANLKTKLTAQHPGKFIRVANSKFEYGPSARHMCALKWTLTNSGCSYDIFIVEFGKTPQEALDLAMKRKAMYAPKNAPFAIVEQTSW